MSTLFSIFNTIQYKLFPWLEEELDPLTEKEQQFDGKESKRSLKMGDKVRARIVTISKKSTLLDTKIGLTMRQPALGNLGWLEADANAAGKKDVPVAKESKKPKEAKK